jgi:hypothetical protein
MFHLALGNLFLGVLEGLLLARFFKLSPGRCVGLLIPANYLSAFAGLFIVGSGTRIPDVTIENLRFWFCIGVIASLAVTLVIEFPSFWFALRGKPGAFSRAIRGDLAVHAISYPLLFLGFWMVSGTEFLTRVTVVSPGAISPAKACDLYFITPDGTRVVRTRVIGGDQTTIRAVSAPDRGDRLFVRQSTDGKYQLWLHLADNPVEGREELLLEDFADEAVMDPPMALGWMDTARSTWQNFGDAPILGSSSPWESRTGFWPVQGITSRNVEDGTHVRLSLETPLVHWAARNATQLPGGTLVFQLGDDQICQLDPVTRRVALLARGKGPVVSLPKGSGSQSDTQSP